VMKNGLVKITDFGIAQMSSASRTMSGMVMGSPKYMSPEQVVGQSVDGRSDIFSLAVVLYEMLTGKTPFSGDNISAIMYQILNDEPIPPKAFNQSIPDSINYIVLKALAKHPDKRYQNAKDMARDLKRYKTMEVPAEGDRAPAPERMERRAKPRDSEMDATQMMPSALLQGENSTLTKNEKTLDGWWNTQRFLLYAAIPAMIVTFAAVVTLSKTRNVVDPNASSSETSLNLTRPTPDKTASELAVTTPQQAPEKLNPPTTNEQVATETKPSIAEKPGTKDKVLDARDIAKEKAKLKREKAKLASAESAKKSEDKNKPTATQPSSVTLAISPWGEVFVDGTRQGVSPPLRELSLEPGKHTILIVNETFKPYSKTIDLAPNSTFKIKYKFQN